MIKGLINRNKVIANMDKYPKDIVLQVIKESIDNPKLISPGSAKILSGYLNMMRKKNAK